MDIRIFGHPGHEAFRGASREECEKRGRKDETPIAAGPDFPHIVDDIRVDKDALPCSNLHRFIECLNRDPAICHRDELQVLMPMHHLKARIPGRRLIVDHIQHQIRKPAPGIQIDGIDIAVFFHAENFMMTIL
ncbi:unknown [Sutterella sp. CAG:351]|nr:unknown [Sutterella sp. CAG:351]